MVYTWMNVVNFDVSIFKNFSSLEGVMTLFQNKDLVVACWVHILAFDLIGAVWIKQNSVKHGIKHIALLPTFLFTYVFGPLGFLIYLLTRWIKTKRYFADNN